MNTISNDNIFEIIKEIPDKSFDIIITDPPYDFDEDRKTFLQKHFIRISKNGVVVFSPPENQWVMPCDQFCFWIKPISTKNTIKKYSRFVEMIFFYNIKIWNLGFHWSQYTNVFFDLVEDNRQHPFTKPISLIKRLIRLHTHKNDIIFDPFAGSGNHLKAAKQLNRKYFGCENDFNYYKKLEKRSW